MERPIIRVRRGEPFFWVPNLGLVRIITVKPVLVFLRPLPEFVLRDGVLE